MDVPPIERLSPRDVAPLRERLSELGVVVAEIDRDLRYVWVDNPHPDFDAAAVVGKRDEELIGEGTSAITALKQAAFDTGQPQDDTLEFERSDGLRRYRMLAIPVVNDEDCVVSVVTVSFEAHKV